MLLNCGVGEDSWESLGLQGDQTSLIKEINPEYSLEADAEVPVLWPPDSKSWLIGKDPDAEQDWRRRRGNRGWDDWMASQTQWTWVGASSGSWWWTVRPGVLQSMGLQRVRHDWVTELNEKIKGLAYNRHAKISNFFPHHLFPDKFS